MRPRWVVATGAPMVVGAEPVSAPFPSIAGDGIEPVAIGRESLNRAGALVPIVAGIVVGEIALPDVAAMFAVGTELVTPRISVLLKAASRRILPLCLRGQPLSRPLRICNGVIPGDMHYGMLVAVREV